jgi:hypothetical protein
MLTSLCCQRKGNVPLGKRMHSRQMTQEGNVYSRIPDRRQEDDTPFARAVKPFGG